MQLQDNPQSSRGDVSEGSDSGQVLVLDTSAFFLSVPLSGRLFTVPRVEGELKDLRGKARLAVLMEEGLEIRVPGLNFQRKVLDAAKKSCDFSVLSATDTDLLALSCELRGTLVTDDFAIQNTAHTLGIPVRSLIQRSASARIWQLRCTGCGKYFDQVPTKAGDCPICGSELKRKHK